MKSDYCKTCKYCSWMVGIGFGIRCNHPENKMYRTERSGNKKLNVIISEVPTGCKYREVKEIIPQ